MPVMPVILRFMSWTNWKVAREKVDKNEDNDILPLNSWCASITLLQWLWGRRWRRIWLNHIVLYSTSKSHMVHNSLSLQYDISFLGYLCLKPKLYLVGKCVQIDVIRRLQMKFPLRKSHGKIHLITGFYF